MPGWRENMLILIDNYDSFTFNIYQYLAELGEHVIVLRNNKVTLEDILSLQPDRVVVSPGPSTPQNAGISNEVIKLIGPRVPLLGICLGHQCIGYSFGGMVRQAESIMHGKSSKIYHKGEGLFTGIPSPFTSIRYHSLIVDRDSLPDCLEITAWTEDGTIMGLKHRQYSIEGVQFHPESFMTEFGKDILRNFLNQGRTYHD